MGPTTTHKPLLLTLAILVRTWPDLLEVSYIRFTLQPVLCDIWTDVSRRTACLLQLLRADIDHILASDIGSWTLGTALCFNQYAIGHSSIIDIIHSLLVIVWTLCSIIPDASAVHALSRVTPFGLIRIESLGAFLSFKTPLSLFHIYLLCFSI